MFAGGCKEFKVLGSERSRRADVAALWGRSVPSAALLLRQSSR